MFSDVIILLSFAVVSVAIFQRLRIPPVLAYLLAGVLAGPFGFALIVEQQDVELLAELGIVFLMFSLGLEFSLPRLWAMRHLVIGLGGGQVLFVGSAFFVLALANSFDVYRSFIIASALLMSSTAIVIKQLSEAQLLTTRISQLSISVLLFQDVAVVAFLIMIPLLAQAGGDLSIFAEHVGWAMIKGTFAVAMILAIGRWILPTLFQQVALSKSDELFVMSTLLVALLAGALTHWLGLSMALGAFLIGMMLGEGPYRHQLEADIRPFRDVLMGLFFITIGMQFDAVTVLLSWPILLLILAAMMLVKILLVFILGKLLKERSSDALATGLILSQMGEFGFVILALAGHWQLLAAEQISLLIGVGVLSMALTPWLVQYHSVIVRRFLWQKDPNNRSKLGPPLPGQYIDHVIVCGYGRSGQTIARFLKIEGIAYVVIDRDPVNVQEALDGGEKIEFGDATRKEILMMLGVNKAKSVIITFKGTDKAIALLQAVRQLSQTKVLVRTTDDSNMRRLQEAGASDVVPESLEGSLMMVSHVLAISGVPIKRILARLQRERQSQYTHLHGFYFGSYEADDISNQSDYELERLHPVRLESGAHAIGKSVQDLGLKRVSYQAVRRQNIEITAIEDQFIFQAEDVVLLCGPSYFVKKAEHCLINGWV